MGYKMKERSIIDGTDKHKKAKLDHIGTGFMKPPYKDTVKLQKSGVPYAKRQGYHGFKDFDSIIPQFQKTKTKK